MAIQWLFVPISSCQYFWCCLCLYNIRQCQQINSQFSVSLLFVKWYLKTTVFTVYINIMYANMDRNLVVIWKRGIKCWNTSTHICKCNSLCKMRYKIYFSLVKIPFLFKFKLKLDTYKNDSLSTTYWWLFFFLVYCLVIT